MHRRLHRFCRIMGARPRVIRNENQQIIDKLVPAIASVYSRFGSGSNQSRSEHEQRLKKPLDRQRLRSIGEILTHSYDYLQQQSYVERERLATIIENRVEELISEIEENPTKHSLEMYRAYLLTLGKTIGEHFAGVQHAAEPEQLECTLSVDTYIPTSNGDIECQVTIQIRSNSPHQRFGDSGLRFPNWRIRSPPAEYPSQRSLARWTIRRMRNPHLYHRESAAVRRFLPYTIN